MRYDSANLPPNIKAAMDRAPAIRAVLVPPPVFQVPPVEDIEPPDAYPGLEKHLHRQFAQDMERRGVHLVHARTDTESSIEPGLPDFHCHYTGADGITRSCAVEFKRSGGTCSATQRLKIAEMRRKKIPVKVCWTLKDAIDFTRATIGC